MMESSAAARQARWLLWQSSGVEAVGLTETPRQEIPLPEPAIPRSRYNAVIRRMQQANQRTGTYTSWNQSGVTQPSSGRA